MLSHARAFSILIFKFPGEKMDLNRFTGFVRRCADDYGMLMPGDRVAVGVSGGKDSMALLAALAHLRRYHPSRFEIEAITIDLGFEGMDFGACRKPFGALSEEGRAQLAAMEADLARAQARAEETERTLDANKAAIIDAMNRLSDVRATQTRLTTMRQSLEKRLEESVSQQGDMERERARLQAALEVTIPLWKNQMAAALGLARATDSMRMQQQAAAQAERGIRDGTRELKAQHSAWQSAAAGSDREAVQQTAQELLAELEHIERSLKDQEQARQGRGTQGPQ